MQGERYVTSLDTSQAFALVELHNRPRAPPAAPSPRCPTRSATAAAQTWWRRRGRGSRACGAQSRTPAPRSCRSHTLRIWRLRAERVQSQPGPPARPCAGHPARQQVCDTGCRAQPSCLVTFCGIQEGHASVHERLVSCSGAGCSNMLIPRFVYYVSKSTNARAVEGAGDMQHLFSSSP